jgi:RNA-directed DNA polymerase
MGTPGEQRPASVGDPRKRSRPKQAGQTGPLGWDWVERSVWTERMLEALHSGVRGGVWYSLMDKVYRASTLAVAWARVRRNGGGAGVDGQSVEAFEARAGHHLERLRQQLQAGTYRPFAVKRVWIDKPGSRQKRPLGVPTVRDRVVQTALRLVLEPIFEREFTPRSFGFRPGRGCTDALRLVVELLRGGCIWVVDADLKGYFDSIPHAGLMAQVRQRIADGRVLGLIEQFLCQGVLEGMRHWTPETGTPQGAVISPLLANIYLHPVDQAMASAGYEMVRYADDFVILCRSQARAEQALAAVRRLVGQRGLILHPDKTRVVNAAEAGFEFLGYHFERGKRWPRDKSMAKLKDAVRAKTRRTSGQSLACIIADVNPTLRGWFGYFKHSHANTFPSVDGWVRRRLRSILRKRSKGRGISRGRDHQRWPNAYFRELGLYSLEAAHRSLLQSGHG